MATIIVTAADVTLFHVALRELGDATQAWRIMQMNGISDPDLSSFVTPVTISLPVIDTTQTSGVPSS